MELVNQYLEDIVKVHGVYLLRVDDSVTDEDKHYIYESWGETMPGKVLLIMPKEFEINFLERYSFYVAMMLVRNGDRVTRDKWVKETVGKNAGGGILGPRTRMLAPHLALNGQDKVVYRVPGKEDALYVVTKEDMDAEDYVRVAK